MKLQLLNDDGTVLWELPEVELADFDGDIRLGLGYLIQALWENTPDHLLTRDDRERHIARDEPS